MNIKEIPEEYNIISEFLEKEAELDRPIYHYTKWEGLKGILEKKQLWLTDYRYLNDTTELSYGYETIRDYIVNLKLDLNKEYFKSNFELLHTMKKEIYIASFCKNPDYLYAWLVYANDGCGFSIGFKEEFVNALNKKENNDIPIFGRTNVFYGKCVTEANEKLAEKIRKLITILKNDIKTFPINSHEWRMRYAIFCSRLWPLIVAIKHYSYQCEEEYRIYRLSKDKETTQKFFSPGSNADMPHLGSKPSTYFQFDLSAISEIWIGPRLNFEHAEEDIKKLLKEHHGAAGDHIKFHNSKIPYKNKTF